MLPNKDIRFLKILISACLCLFFINQSFSQDLYVDDDSFLYAQDVVVFVNDDIRLETATSNLYFRGDAQLLQNTDLKNSDEGELSIYQNQTTNIYEYNYWCSPVGVAADGTAQANVDFNGSNIHDPTDDTDLSNINSSAYLFTSAVNGTATELSNYWMYTLRDGEGYFYWQQIYDTGSAGTGYGFTMKGSPTANNVLDFRGRPNNGTIIVSCAFDGTDNQPNSGTLNTAQTLTGNPYPSALDLKLFFVNSATNQSRFSGEIFFWEQAVTNTHTLTAYEGGYSIYTPGDLGDLNDNGTYTVAPFQYYDNEGGSIGNSANTNMDYSANNERRYAAVGQGFVIQTVGAGGDATFDNSMRLYLPEDSSTSGNGAVFAKGVNSKSEKTEKEVLAMSHNGVDYKSIIENPKVTPEIRIHTHINNAFYKENVIAFRENTPDNNTYNRFYDGSNINELVDDAYLISSDKPLAIKSINYDDATRLSFGLKASKGNTIFSISINELSDIENDINIYLYDNVNNTYTDIKNGIFNITLDEGTLNDRFEITFNNNVLSTNEDDIIKNFKVFQNNRTSQLQILNTNNLNINALSLYDVSGKQVLNTNISSDNRKHTYSTKSYSDGVYIVKITSDNNQIFSKKIVIGNNN